MARGVTPSDQGSISEAIPVTLTTGTAGALLTPEQVESLLIKPVLAASVTLNPLCSRVLRPTAPPSGCPP